MTMNSATIALPESMTTGSLISRDGTTIGYRQIGQGPGLVIVHGSMSTGYNHVQLAKALADVYTVYLLDRRGFGLSGTFGADYSIQKNVEDLDALLTQTDAHHVFGVSVGGIISLRAALSLPSIHKLAIYEPPLFTNPSAPIATMLRFDEEMAQGKVAAALTTSMKGVPLGPALFSVMPRWVLERMTNMMMSQEDKKGSSPYTSFRELASTLHYDGQVITEMSGQQERFRDIKAQVLLLGGSKSPAFLKNALVSVEKTLPNVQRVELSGLDHSSSWNADKRGKPEIVARELRRFFS